MLLNILKKDLKRKRTMNIILFLFIVMATTFISSSVNNIISITNAMNHYIEKAGISDLSVFVFDNGGNNEGMDDFISNNNGVNEVKIEYYPYITDSDLSFEEERELDSIAPLIFGSAENCNYKVFDENNNVIQAVANGEMYMSASFMNKFDFSIGDTVTINKNNYSRKFTITKTYKDIVFSAGMIGVDKFLISEDDYQDMLKSSAFPELIVYGIYTNNVKNLFQELNESEVSTALTFDHSQLKNMYIIDMVIAGVMLIVSICLIAISIVILRFTIVFTLTEEFREIGVMKAIGITNWKIRGIYCVKYLGMSIAGAILGAVCGVPFGNLLLSESSQNIVIETNTNYLVNILCGLIVVAIIMIFCFIATGKIKKFSPIDAIRNGSNGERYHGKNILKLNKTKITPIGFLSLNDIFSGLRRFGVLIIAFTIGIILIIIPVNTSNTLSSDNLISWFSMVKSDVYITDNSIFGSGAETREDIFERLEEMEKNLADNNIPAKVSQEYLFSFIVSKGEKTCSSTATQNLNAKAEDYAYISGTPPQNEKEVAITHIIAEKIDAKIGDTISIKMDGEPISFVVSAIYQSMLNMGEGIRFYQNYPLDYSNIMGMLAMQIRYTDNPTENVKQKRMETIRELYPDMKTFTGGEYVADMIGVSIDSMIHLIVLVVLCINALVTVLMVKSFIIKEKGEIGMLKAIGFNNNALIRWHTLRIGIVLIISTILAILLSNPLGQISSGMIFKMMGASSIEFEVRPLEIYVIYPLIVLTVTLAASFLTAQQIRKISASETNNIE